LFQFVKFFFPADFADFADLFLFNTNVHQLFTNVYQYFSLLIVAVASLQRLRR